MERSNGPRKDAAKIPTLTRENTFPVMGYERESESGE